MRAEPRLAAWPEWFAAVDVVLALVGVVLAFLLASFAARNSDVWLHLAGGRLIAAGELGLGTDSMSFAEPARPWVRTTWLFDLAAYLAYKADASGVTLVGVKAAVFAAAFALFGLLRRPGHALWPWAVVGVLAALAAAPYALLRPAVASVALLSLTMALIARLPWRSGSWREPGILAGVFALWANVDAWFFLGPLALACVLVGELAQRRLFGPATADPADPFPAAPPVSALAKALGLGVVACLLNPFFLAALVKDPGEAFGQLVPPELGFLTPAGATESFELINLTLSPLSPQYLAQESLGKGVNGVAYAALLVSGVAALLLGFGRLRAAHVALWLAFGGLSLLHVRLIPYFAVVVAPIVAGHANGLSWRLKLGRAADPQTRILLTACGLGRVLSVALLTVMLLATYPGWLHPASASRSAQNRLDWSLAPEAGLERSAKLLAQLRADGALGDGPRGLNVSADFGNYVAWHAPGERVFVNGRYSYHRRELPDLVAARQGVGSRRGNAEGVARSKELNRVVIERDADSLVVAGVTGGRTDTQSGQRTDAEGVLGLAFDDERWVLWHLDGRLAVLGRLTGDAAADAKTRARRFDAARAAFGPGLAKLPAAKALPLAPAPELTAEQYLDRPLPLPPETDDAATYRIYADYARQRAENDYRRAVEAVLPARWALIGAGRPPLFPQPPREDDVLTVPLLMVRAARQAIAANPAPAEPYFLLAEAYGQPGAPVGDGPLFGDVGERELQTVAALSRALERVPPVPGYARGGLAEAALQQSFALVAAFEQSNQIDAASQAYDRHVAYFNALPEPAQKAIAASQGKPGAKPEDALKARQAEALGRQDKYATEVDRRREAVKRVPDPLGRFQAAAQVGLPLYAIEVFNAIPPDAAKPIPPQAVLAKVALALRAGRLEDAASDLAALDDSIQTLQRQNPADPVAQGFLALQMVAARLEGNPGADNAVLPRPAFPKVAYDPTASRLPAVLVGLQALAGSPVGLLQSEQAAASRAPILRHLNQIDQARAILLQNSAFSYDRAMLALLNGDTADARGWLTESLTPQGVKLADLGEVDRAARAERYLQLIDRAATPLPK